jgi:hypothetical protein
MRYIEKTASLAQGVLKQIKVGSMHLISPNEAHKICNQTNSQTITNQIKPL